MKNWLRCINFTVYLHCKHCCDCQLVLLKKLDDDDDATVYDENCAWGQEGTIEGCYRRLLYMAE